MPRPLPIDRPPISVSTRCHRLRRRVAILFGLSLLLPLLARPAQAQMGPLPSVPLSNLGQAGGSAQLDSTGHVPIAELPLGSSAASIPVGNDSRFTTPAITGGTINGAILGAVAPLPQVNLGGTYNFSGADANANKGLIASGALQGATTSNQSSVWNFNVSSDQVAVPNGWINDFNINCTMGGGNFSGLRDCFATGVAVVAPAAASDTSSMNYVSNIATAYSTVNNGGTAGPFTARGSITGYNANVRLATYLTNAATFWNTLQAQENDVSVLAGASVASLYGLSIDQVGNHAVHGTYDDTGIVFSNDNGAAGWNCGICFGNTYAAWPIAPGGTLLGAVIASRNSNSSQAMTATNGVDLRNVTFSGYAFASPGFTVDGAGHAAVANISSPSIASAGSVTGITFPGNLRGQYPANAFPTLTIAAPTGIGSTATAAVTNMAWTGGPSTFVSGGAGCSVNDLLTPVGYTGTPFQMKVTAVSGGVVTAMVPAGNGAGNMTAPFATATLTMSGGTCTTAPTYAVNLYILTAAITGGGNGYTTPPTVTSSASPLSTATMGTTIGNNLTVAGNLGQVLLNGSGTTLGVAGTAGAPVILASALADQSKTRLTATGAAYTVPVGTSWLAMVQTATVAAQTVTLPAPIDGQKLLLTTAGAITALTFSPAVPGWTNGATLPANAGLALGWDAGSSAWMLESAPGATSYTLPTATASVLGGVELGTGVTAPGGVLAVTYGTASGTAAAGNDSRITGALQASAIPSAAVTAPECGSGAAGAVAACGAGMVLPTGTTAATGQTGATVATNTDLAAKAPLASPALTGVPTAPTAAASVNTVQVATTAFVYAGNGQDIQTFAASGTWTKPAFCSNTGVTCTVRLRVIGAGGGGGGGGMEALGTAIAGGAAGGGGACYDALDNATRFTSTVTVTIGAGGAAGAGATVAGSGGNGSTGGNTTFGSYYTGYAGGGGGGGTTAGSGGGSGGGLTAPGGNGSGATAAPGNVTSGVWAGAGGNSTNNTSGPLNTGGAGATTAVAGWGVASPCVSGSAAGASLTTSAATVAGYGGGVVGVGASTGGAAASSGTAPAGANAAGNGALIPATAGAAGGGANTGGTGGAGGAGVAGAYGCGGAGGGAGTAAGGAGGVACGGYVVAVTTGSVTQ